MQVSRDQIIDFLSAYFKKQRGVKAAFLSGSQAFDRQDDLSDIDLRIVADTEHSDQIVSDLEVALNSFVGIEDSYSPAYANLKQRFYKLKNASPFHMLDVLVFTEEYLPVFLSKQSMGPNPLVFCDESHLIQTIDTLPNSAEAFKVKIDDYQKQFTFLARILVERAIKRNRYTEALYFYNARIILPLIEMLRYRYSRVRQDYGLRYLADDLPGSIVAILDELHRISSFEDLQKNLDKAEKLFYETVKSGS